MVRRWAKTVEQSAAARERAGHFDVATQCFLAVVEDCSAGGSLPGQDGHVLARTAWFAAVLTAMVHVRGVYPQPHLLRVPVRDQDFPWHAHIYVYIQIYLYV